MQYLSKEMKSLRLASFGIRGFVGETLDPKRVIDFASAFATYKEGGRILLGRDTRYSSPMLHAAVVSGLLSAGCEVLDFGVCPTPVLQFSVNAYEAAGAVSISGGHHAMGWNAVNLIGGDGAYLEPMGGETVLDIFHSGDFLKRDWQGIGRMQSVNDFIDPYFEALEALLDAEVIRKAAFTVLIDPVCGAGCAYLERFARRFGLRLIPINADPSGYLAREAEPRPRTARPMASIIKHVEGDAGFVLNSDMSRMSLVTEEAEAVSEEYTVAVISDYLLAKHTGPLITNCCTTRILDDIAERQQVPVVKTKVGQPYIVSALADEQGVLGGEGSGSVCVPSFSPAFDGFVMMGLTLEAMAHGGRSLSRLIQALPKYVISKRKIQCGPREGYLALEQLERKWMKEVRGRVDFTDGLRIDWDDGWIHARASRTEQIIRIISEAVTREVAERRGEQAIRDVEAMI